MGNGSSYTGMVENDFMELWNTYSSEQYDELRRLRMQSDVRQFLDEKLHGNVPGVQLRRYLAQHWTDLFPGDVAPQGNWQDWTEKDVGRVARLLEKTYGMKEEKWRKYLSFENDLLNKKWGKTGVKQIALRIGMTDRSTLLKFFDAVSMDGLNYRDPEDLIFSYVQQHPQGKAGSARYDRYAKMVTAYRQQVTRLSLTPDALPPMTLGMTRVARDLASVDFANDEEFLESLLQVSDQLHGFSLRNTVYELRLIQYIAFLLDRYDDAPWNDGEVNPDSMIAVMLRDMEITHEPIRPDEYGLPESPALLVRKLLVGLNAKEYAFLNEKRRQGGYGGANRFFAEVAAPLEKIAASLNNKKEVLFGRQAKSREDIDKYYQNNLKQAEVRRSEIVFLILLLFLLADGQEVRGEDLPDLQTKLNERFSLKGEDQTMISAFDANVCKALSYVYDPRAPRDSFMDLQRYMAAFDQILESSFSDFHRMYLPNTMDAYALSCFMSGVPKDFYVESVYPLDPEDEEDEESPEKEDPDRVEVLFIPDLMWDADTGGTSEIGAKSATGADMADLSTELCLALQDRMRQLDDIALLRAICEETEGNTVSLEALQRHFDEKEAIWNLCVGSRLGFRVTCASQNAEAGLWLGRIQDLFRRAKDPAHLRSILYAIDRRIWRKLVSGAAALPARFDPDAVCTLRHYSYEKFAHLLPRDNGRVTGRHFYLLLAFHLSGGTVDLPEEEHTEKKLLSNDLRKFLQILKEQKDFTPRAGYQDAPGTVPSKESLDAALAEVNRQVSDLLAGLYEENRRRAEDLVGTYAYLHKGVSSDPKAHETEILRGMLEAAKYYNPSRNAGFFTYASYYVRLQLDQKAQEDLQHLSIPKSEWEMLRKMQKIEEDARRSRKDISEEEILTILCDRLHRQRGFMEEMYTLSKSLLVKHLDRDIWSAGAMNAQVHSRSSTVHFPYEAVEQLPVLEQSLVERLNDAEEPVKIAAMAKELDLTEDRVQYMLRKAYGHLISILERDLENHEDYLYSL